MLDKPSERHNDDAEQTLNTLWQQQQTEPVAVDAVKQKWLKIKLKQRLYFAVDIAGVFFMLGVFYIAFDKMGLFAKTWMALLTLFAGGTAVYFSYLRRFALSWSNVGTGSYIQQLKQQLISNIRIATLNRDLSLWMILAIGVFYTGMFYFDNVVLETAVRKGLISLAILAVFTPPFWFWANRRAKRFTRELDALDHLLAETDTSQNISN
jgi:Flp pilus assembly protein TadB